MTYTRVAKKFNRPNRPITRSAITRHSKHVLSPSPEGHRPRGGSPGPPIEGQSLLERVEGLIAESKAIAERAKSTDQLVAATGALREIRSCIELMAKLSGELSSANVNFFAMELSEDRIGDFIEAAARRGVGEFVRDQALKRFGGRPPDIHVHFVDSPKRDADRARKLLDASNSAALQSPNGTL